MIKKSSGNTMEELTKILYRLQQLRDAVDDAAMDFKTTDYPAVFNLDWNVLHPSITPRDNKVPTPISSEEDYFRYSVINEATEYKNVMGGNLAVSPLALLELSDQVLHKREFYATVYNSKNSDEMYKAIGAHIGGMPKTKDELDNFTYKIIKSLGDNIISTRVAKFRDLVNKGVIKNILCLVNKDAFMDAMHDNENFQTIYNHVGKFRREDNGKDHVDAEMHKIIDALMILTSQAMHKKTNQYSVFYVGQDKLRGVYGKNMSKYSRSVLSIHVMLRSLRECPSDRDIKGEVQYNLQKRGDRLREDHEHLLFHMNRGAIPSTLVKSIASMMTDMNNLIYEGVTMIKPKDLEGIMSDVVVSPYKIKEAFRNADTDLVNSQEIIAELASSIVNESFREAIDVLPNERLVQILDELGEKPKS